MSHRSQSSKRLFRALEALHEIATECSWVQVENPEPSFSGAYYVEYTKEGRKNETFYVSGRRALIVPFNEKVKEVNLYDPKSLSDFIWFLKR